VRGWLGRLTRTIVAAAIAAAAIAMSTVSMLASSNADGLSINLAGLPTYLARDAAFAFADLSFPERSV
jgi:hypothetical protein